MKTFQVLIIACAAGLILAIGSCKDSPTGPNDLGGETNLELTQVGNEFGAYVSAGSNNPAFQNLQDSIVITKNDNGIVTTHAKLTFDTTFVQAFDTALGTEGLPWSAKFALIDTYFGRFGATLDTTNKSAIKVEFDLKLKVTSEGIQEFVNSRGDLSRPFTIVKYGASVGDRYEFTNNDGVKVTRTVTRKSTTDDYPIGFWMIKVIEVEETKADPLMEKVTYYANHKFGLVGVVFKTKNGKEVKLGIYPPTL